MVVSDVKHDGEGVGVLVKRAKLTEDDSGYLVLSGGHSTFGVTLMYCVELQVPNQWALCCAVVFFSFVMTSWR